MAEWRITEQHPVRNIDRLDHERCAILHNLIIARGWEQSGRSLQDLDRRTWWELHYSSGTTGSLSFLGEDVVAFLKNAQTGHCSNVEDIHTLHRYLIGLSVPDLLNANAMYAPEEDDSNKRRFITLYQENPFLDTNHSLGLLYDQSTHRAIHVESQDYCRVAQNGRQEWLPLEVILEAYLQMIDRQKIHAVGDDYEGDQERADPWIMPSYTTSDLTDTIAAWNELIDAVEQRMGLEAQIADHRTLPKDLYGNINFSETSFASEFINSARMPRFKHIAPGLRLPSKQPFTDTSLDEDEHRLRPTLLLQSDLLAHQDIDRSPYGHSHPICNFRPDIEREVTSALPAGLYLTESEPNSMHPYEDGVKLLLPFTLGSNKCARRSDNSLVGEAVFEQGPEAPNQPRSSELYQSGFNAYITSHDVQLRHVLVRWRDMVVQGKWQVDEEGVMGGIEKWKEADAEATWKDYVLHRTW